MKNIFVILFVASIMLISCSGTYKKTNEDVIARTERTWQSQEIENNGIDSCTLL